MLIRLIDHRIGVELAFALRTLRSQDVALKRVSALDLAGACLLETLGRSLMCLQLGHSGISITTHIGGLGQSSAAGVVRCLRSRGES